jgi:P27 family predicted phage terminase small subunit
MTRGRKPKPTHLKVVTGNPGRRPLNQQEIEPPRRRSAPKPPAHLLPDAKAEWRRLAPSLSLLGILSDLDVSPFAAYCQSYARWAQAERLLATLAEQDASGRDALLIKTRAGGVTPNPLIWVARNASNDMVRYAAEFGFTPSSRTRVHTTVAAAATGGESSFFDD